MNANQLGAVFEGRLPSTRELHNITEELGVDVATGVLIKILQDSKVHGTFLNRMREIDPADPFDRAGGYNHVEVAIVASNHFASGRAWGDHVETWRRWARGVGFSTEVIETSPRATIAENARILRDFIKENPHQRRFIVTYGQGASEFRYLLQRLEQLKAIDEVSGIRGWLNVCGAVAGSSLNTYLDTGRFGRLRERLRLRWAGRSPLGLHELNHRSGVWRRVLPIPRTLTTVSVAGLPLRTDIPNGLHTYFSQLAKDGPNDGVVGFMESVAHPGFIVPAAGMSHRAPDFRLKPVFERALLVLGRALDAEAAGTRIEGERGLELE